MRRSEERAWRTMSAPARARHIRRLVEVGQEQWGSLYDILPLDAGLLLHFVRECRRELQQNFRRELEACEGEALRLELEASRLRARTERLVQRVHSDDAETAAAKTFAALRSTVAVVDEQEYAEPVAACSSAASSSSTTVEVESQRCEDCAGGLASLDAVIAAGVAVGSCPSATCSSPARHAFFESLDVGLLQRLLLYVPAPDLIFAVQQTSRQLVREINRQRFWKSHRPASWQLAVGSFQQAVKAGHWKLLEFPTPTSWCPPPLLFEAEEDDDGSPDEPSFESVFLTLLLDRQRGIHYYDDASEVFSVQAEDYSEGLEAAAAEAEGACGVSTPSPLVQAAIERQESSSSCAAVVADDELQDGGEAAPETPHAGGLLHGGTSAANSELFTVATHGVIRDSRLWFHARIASREGFWVEVQYHTDHTSTGLMAQLRWCAGGGAAELFKKPLVDWDDQEHAGLIFRTGYGRVEWEGPPRISIDQLAALATWLGVPSGREALLWQALDQAAWGMPGMTACCKATLEEAVLDALQRADELRQHATAHVAGGQADSRSRNAKSLLP
eukprot:TRINITY_DN28655_c1_g2_i1.p1 TRINITY_DN28655_c1_g2~~TRINITY_DN28655_c1_g2_i1.p1  ORF type:complete len:560 (+),score=153.60 TRINITY_DN28655_c1_g2_i1:501-2180(+)